MIGTSKMPQLSMELTTETQAMASPAPRRRLPFWQTTVLLSLMLVGALFVFTKWPHYAGTAVCRECGMRQDGFDWTLRSSQLVLHRFTRDNPTALSRALADGESLLAHQHHWAEITRPSAPASDSADIPPNLLYTVESPLVAQFASDLAHSANHDAVAKWKSLLLDPSYSTVWEESLRFMRYPRGGFPDAAAFQNWWREAEFPLWNHLRELTEPD